MLVMVTDTVQKLYSILLATWNGLPTTSSGKVSLNFNCRNQMLQRMNIFNNDLPFTAVFAQNEKKTSIIKNVV